MRSLFPNAVTAYSVMIWSKGLSLSAMTEAFIFGYHQFLGTFHYSLPFELYQTQLRDADRPQATPSP